MADKRAKMFRPLPVADLLGNLFSGQPLEGRLREGRIWQIWDEVVGKGVAAKAQPVSFRDGTLTVAVSNAPWMQQLTFMKVEILSKLNRALGEDLVRDIYLKAGKVSSPAKKQAPVRPRQLSAAEREQIARQAAEIDDPELREAVTSLLARHAASKPLS
jgi:hypothetical protein